MAATPSPVSVKFRETEMGRLRIDIPATSIEAENPDELVAQFQGRLKELIADFDALGDKIQDAMMRRLEQITPRGEALERLAEQHPAPPEWYDEPEWTVDDPE